MSRFFSAWSQPGELSIIVEFMLLAPGKRHHKGTVRPEGDGYVWSLSSIIGMKEGVTHLGPIFEHGYLLRGTRKGIGRIRIELESSTSTTVANNKRILDRIKSSNIRICPAW